VSAFRLRFLHKAASVGSFTALTAPTLSGDPVVGQRIRATNGTYSLTSDSITPYWALDGAVDSTVTGDNYLIDDSAVGSVVGYGEIAHRTGKPDTSLNVATSTAAVTDIDLTNAITAFTRTSASGVTPITFSLTYGSNVYEGYARRWNVYSDSGRSDLLSTAVHVLTYDDLQPGATIDLGDEGVSYTATDFIETAVEATSPAGIFHEFSFPDPISPTDSTGTRYMRVVFPTTTTNSFAILVELEVAESIGGSNIATGKSYTFVDGSGGAWSSGPNLFDGVTNTSITGFHPGAEVIIDFGAAVNPVQIRMQGHHDFNPNNEPATVKVYLSTDGSSWGTAVLDTSLAWTSGDQIISKDW
jgi:hypothetical protein